MEELNTIIVEKWPEILSYVFNFVSYFLFLLYRTKFSKTKNSMTLLFKDRVDKVDTIDKNLRSDIEIERIAMREELEASIEEYKKSKIAYEKCMNEMSKMHRAIIEIIAEQEEIDNGTNTER